MPLDYTMRSATLQAAASGAQLLTRSRSCHLQAGVAVAAAQQAAAATLQAPCTALYRLPALTWKYMSSMRT